MAASARRFSRTSAAVLSVVFVAFFSIVRNLHLLNDLGYRDEDEYAAHLPVVNHAVLTKHEKNDDSFSACLLIKDDNHFLIEWLAYHYHTLPLRRLIVAVDPKSKTSPREIFHRWRQHDMMMIDEWSDQDFMPSTAIQDAKLTFQDTKMTDDTRLHHFRQRIFYNKCSQQLKKENRTWTIFLDSDEYLLLNQQQRHASNTPSIKKSGSVLSFLQQRQKKTDSPCIMIPRLCFGAIESDTQSISEGVALNASHFTTLRFRNHAALDDFETNKMGKGILDLSRIPSLFDIQDPHRLVWEYCPESGLKTRNEDSPLVIHHYLGTWEQYDFRDDVRKGTRNRKSFQKFQNLNTGHDEQSAIQPWLGGFIKENGQDAATKLLEGVGDVHRWPFVDGKLMNEKRAFGRGAKANPASLAFAPAESQNEETLAEKDTFSACLLVMDDNYVLKEWLAYHYHSLPLRYLIIAVDPRSITSPTVILNRWRKHDMTIEEWADEDYLSEKKLLPLAQNISQLNETAVIELHLARQQEFYKKCMLSLQKQNRTWTMLLDTDEFLMINKRATDRFNVTDVPPVEQPGSVMTFLQQELAKNETEMPKDTPCIMIPRLRFGSQESELKQVNLDVPHGFNASAFTTLRHRKHAEPVLSKINKSGKVIVDVSRLLPTNMHVNNPHRPLFVYCPKSEMYTQIKDNLFVVHHYSGTLEQFTFRDDARRDAKAKKVRLHHSCCLLMFVLCDFTLTIFLVAGVCSV